ncbi:hypothetical protein [Pseudomonas fluorescens]|uniref:Uncharacterized protein n=1 Tax=Pseudomonas fluorescens TaxID=294 RepID=A0A0F4V765_PSEFL|nr:hypothetical protein [Pseudomonas fluorescens]KJZ64574.1 hypothetical protein VD17_17010 [Pseudomonas fluorescens]
MSVNPIENGAPAGSAAEANFNVALDNATTRATAKGEPSGELSDDELDQLVSQAMVLGGQFIIMPMAQNLLKEAQEDDEE